MRKTSLNPVISTYIEWEQFLQIVWEKLGGVLQKNTFKDCVLNKFLDSKGKLSTWEIIRNIMRKNTPVEVVNLLQFVWELHYWVIWQILQKIVRENISRFPIFTVWKASSVIRCLDRRKHWVQLKTIWSPKYLEIKHQWCSIPKAQNLSHLFLWMLMSFGFRQVQKIRTNVFGFQVPMKQDQESGKRQQI